MFVELGRCWQGKSCYLLWELSLRSATRVQSQKLYLKVDCSQAARAVQVLRAKPLDLIPQGGVASLVRRHLPRCQIHDILRGGESAALCLLVKRGRESGGESPCWYLLLDQHKPPALQLIDSTGTSLVRFGQRGTFSKRKSITEPLPLQTDTSWRSIFAEVFAEALGGEANLAAEESRKPREEPLPVTGLKSAARKLVSRRLKTLSAALRKEEKLLPSEASIAGLAQQALRLQEFVYLLKEGGEKIAAAFSAVKKAKKQRLLALPRLDKLREQQRELTQGLEILRGQTVEDIQVQALLTKFRLKVERSPPPLPGGQAEESRTPYRRYRLEDGAEALVGKSARDNDLLSKYARANDWWFHALGSEGSHVIVPFKSLLGGQLSLANKKQAAILALHNSRLRTNYGGEVYMTRRQHLRKRAGMPPGKWELLKSESLYVTYNEEELKQLLDRFC